MQAVNSDVLTENTGFSKSLSNVHIIIHRIQDVFQQLLSHVLLHNEILAFTHDFQHITKNCQTQPILRRVEIHVEEIKNYVDENEIFKSDFENPVFTSFKMFFNSCQIGVFASK